MSAHRGEFSSKAGFILAASGSAVGLGNIWGFPTNAAENGGGAFVLMYFLLAFCLAYPALMAELVIGRYTKANMVHALQAIAPGRLSKLLGKLTGFYGILVASLILAFYSIVAGWMLAYFFEPVATLLGLKTLASWLTSDSIVRNLVLCFLFLALTCSVIVAGVEEGIEKWSCRLMPALFLMMAGLIVYVMLQPGAITGLKLYLIPDFNQLLDPKLVVSALGQAFFSLSLGVGTMLIYGSYLRPEESLPSMGAIVTLVDSSIAFLAGLLVLPALFVAQQQGLSIYTESGSLIAGPDLIFQTIPALFKNMGTMGIWVAIVFFALMSIAALTSSISMLEVPVSFTIEHHATHRRSATWLIGAIIFACSSVIIINFDALFGLVVTLATEYSQPLLGLMICVFATWVWHRDLVLEEIRSGHPDVEQSLFWKIWPHYAKYCCPILILVLLAQSFINS
ncbi:sodium-dependent transporter [Porticoccus sp.]|nr:MAG: sodium-dependent transporter [Gammaproteobacteria bacterium]